ncbi:hypothetical protein DOK67_0002313 [Enterococcus sp. DIV0212c]|uniref:hypothetical protein n=1 Tax=Enterococcus sp. DIV0212c TaxID=2230867 RepID=UPI001A9B6210|nr:hypothetical protein [Enterococcus sp. DIV0212c]MBO1355281.1 hypothetical protein [Enterococcus sp. DIV0212c]
MSDNEKKILQKAMNQIEVPEEESLNALRKSSDRRQGRHLMAKHKWGEIILSSLVIVCLLFIGTLMWPKAKETTKLSSAVASTSTEPTKDMSVKLLQSTKYWKVQNEENYYRFSNDKVRIIEHYFSLFTTKYTFKGNQLDIIYDSFNETDSPIEEIHSYQVKKSGNNLVLEPKHAEDQRLILEPHNEEIFPYTEETIKKLQPAVDPDLTKYSSWTSSIKGNRQTSTLTFDGFLMKERIDEEEKWMTWTYEIKGNHLLVNYGGHTASLDMYWDGEKIILWPVSNSLPKDQNHEEYKEESVTILEPNR